MHRSLSRKSTSSTTSQLESLESSSTPTEVPWSWKSELRLALFSLIFVLGTFGLLRQLHYVSNLPHLNNNSMNEDLAIAPITEHRHQLFLGGTTTSGQNNTIAKSFSKRISEEPDDDILVKRLHHSTKKDNSPKQKQPSNNDDKDDRFTVLRQAAQQQQQEERHPPHKSQTANHITDDKHLALVDAAFQRQQRKHLSCMVVYHIPKSGGLSLLEYLKIIAHAKGWKVETWYSWYGKNGDTDPKDNLMDYTKERIHIGHLTPHFESMTSTHDCYKMTILREPVDRVISAFYYHKHKDADWPTCLQPKHMTTTCKLWHEYNNDMVRRFANYGTTWNSYVTEKYTQGDEETFDGVELPHTALADAKEIMAAFDFVCFLNNLEPCLRYIGKILDIPERTLLQKRHFVNQNSKRQKISAGLKAKISKANQMDIQLYEWAAGFF